MSWFINSLNLKVIFIKRINTYNIWYIYIINIIYIITHKYIIYLFIICILGKEYTLISSFPENILIFIIWLMLWLQRNTLYSLEAPVTAYKRLKTIGFNNTTVNKWTKKDLASWIFKIVSPFAYLQTDCRKAREHWASEFLDVSGTVELGRWNQFSVNNIEHNPKLNKPLISWMLRETFSFVRVCIIDAFNIEATLKLLAFTCL